MKCLNNKCPVTSNSLLPCLPVPRACAHPVGPARIQPLESGWSSQGWLGPAWSRKSLTPAQLAWGAAHPAPGSRALPGWTLHRHVIHGCRTDYTHTPRVVQTRIPQKGRIHIHPLRCLWAAFRHQKHEIFAIGFWDFRHLISMISF